MYRIVICEQSPSLLIEMKKCIEDNFEEGNIVGCFNKGLDVVDFLKRHFADIVICSVDSVDHDGLTVAKYVYEHKIETQVILSASYHQFEYVKEAIDYRVLSLLIKPFYPQDIINVVQKAKNKINEDLDKAYSDSKGYLLEWEWKKQNLILSFNEITNIDSLIEKNLTFFKDKTLRECCCDEITVRALNFSSQKFSNNEGKIKKFYSDMKDIAEGETNTFAAFQVKEKDDTVSFIVFFAEGSDGINDFITNLKSSMKKLYNIDLEFKVNEYKNIKDLLSARKNSKLISAYIDALTSDDFKNAFKVAEKIKRVNETAQIKNMLKEIEEQLLKEYEIKINLNSYLENNDDIKAVLDEVLKRTESVLSASRYLVVGIKNYVRNNFSNNLTIEEISRVFSMSASYIGRAFKDETGQKLIDFLLEEKFNRAKRLLSSGNYAVKDVAHLVGYNQVKYFASTFKKRVGMTPSEYVKRSKSTNI